MIDILRSSTPEEAYSYYRDQIPDITQEEAYRLMSFLQRATSPRLSRAEKLYRYGKYQELLKQLQSGNKTRLQNEWEQPAMNNHSLEYFLSSPERSFYSDKL